jgi:hypothetical protein
MPATYSVSPTGRIASGPRARGMLRACTNTGATTLLAIYAEAAPAIPLWFQTSASMLPA